MRIARAALYVIMGLSYDSRFAPVDLHTAVSILFILVAGEVLLQGKD